MRKIFIILSAVFVIVSCGGDSDTLTIPPGSGPGGTVVPILAALSVITSNPQIPSDGALPVSITAFLKDTNNNFVAGQLIEFSSDSGGIGVTQAITNANGQATATLGTSGDPTNRTITVTATAGTLSDTVAVQVIGTQLEISGPDSLVQGDTSTYSLLLSDASGKGIANQTVDIVSSSGNTLAATTLTTDFTGQAQVDLMATQGGPDNLTATALGLMTVKAISVSDDSFAFVTPAAGTEIDLGTQQLVTVRWTKDGVAQAGESIIFSTTRGSITPSTSIVTNASGEASINISSTNAGAAVISAAATGGPTTQRTVEFVATTPASIEVQANPFTVAPNEQSQITAVVRDGANNLVKNARVSFTLSDITSGQLSIGSALTNSQGRAQTFYTASDTVSGNEGVTIRAEIENNQLISDTVTLTVARRELFVAIGTGNELVEPDMADYEIEFSVQVTDSEGNGVPQTTVQLNTKSTRYQKGWWVQGATSWVPLVTATCNDEDVNGNGILDPSEFDENNNGTIEAGNVVLVAPGQPITDATGKSLVKLIYAQVYGAWTEIKLEARLPVQGEEFVESQTFGLQITADDAELDGAPPGILTPPDAMFGPVIDDGNGNFVGVQFLASPWGYGPTCGDDF